MIYIGNERIRTKDVATEDERMIDDYSVSGIGKVTKKSGLVPLKVCTDGANIVGGNGVLSITSTGDGKVEFIDKGSNVIAYVKSALGYPAYYPLHEVKIEKPLKAVLMDLDGTTVRSEGFWMWTIQLTICDLLGNPKFQLEDADKPFISGLSVSEHLQYCINKYCPDKNNHRCLAALQHKYTEGDGKDSPGAWAPGSIYSC